MLLEITHKMKGNTIINILSVVIKQGETFNNNITKYSDNMSFTSFS
jgi:hypothetical protein